MTDKSSKTIGFVGLGRMGSGIARNLAASGFSLVAFDIDSGKRKAIEPECKAEETLEAVFERADILFLSPPGSAEVEPVVRGFIAGGVRGKLVVDLSTSLPTSSRRLYREMKSAGGDFLDASLSGGPRNAAEGTLNVMVGGDEATFRSILPLLECFAKNTFHAGGPGAGNVIKLASNYLSIMYIGLYAEIIPFVKKLGVDPQKLFEVVSVSGANSGMFQSNARKMIDRSFDFSFQMALGIKDLGYLKELFEEQQKPSELLDAGLDVYGKAEQMNLMDRDISEVVKIVERMYGVEDTE